MQKIIARLRREPVAVRGFIAAVLNLAVAGGLDTGVSTEAEVIVLAVLNLTLFAGARSKVTPVE